MPRPADPAHDRVGPRLGCAEVLERLEAFIDGELETAACAGVEAHLAMCPACRGEEQLARRVQEELRTLGELDAPGPVMQAIREAAAVEASRLGVEPALRGVRRSADGRHSWRIGPRPWLAAAAAVLLGIALALALGPWRRAGTGPVREAHQTDSAVVTAGPAGPAEPSAAEVAAARSQARLALSMVATVGRRAGQELQRDVVVRQLLRPAIQSLERWHDPIEPSRSNLSTTSERGIGSSPVPAG